MAAAELKVISLQPIYIACALGRKAHHPELLLLEQHPSAIISLCWVEFGVSEAINGTATHTIHKHMEKKRCCTLLINKRNKNWVPAAVRLLNSEKCHENSHCKFSCIKGPPVTSAVLQATPRFRKNHGSNLFQVFKMLHFGFGQFSNFITPGLNS